MKWKGDNSRKVPVNDIEKTDGLPEEAAAATGEVPVEQPETTVAAEEIEKARGEAKEAQDKYLRLYAETDNFKKRMARESVEREKYHNEAILKELLPVLDNLERALAHAGESGGEGEGIIEGVKMVRKQFLDTIAKFGVIPVETKGLPFDPNIEQAVMQVETEDYEPGMVVDEFQRGYTLNDRLLRAAMVTVSKRPEGE